MANELFDYFYGIYMTRRADAPPPKRVFVGSPRIHDHYPRPRREADWPLIEIENTVEKTEANTSGESDDRD